VSGKLKRLARELRHRTHLVTLGATFALGAGYLNGSCVASGQCAACDGNCAVRLPILALPLLVDGLITLLRHRWRGARTRWPGLPHGARGTDRSTQP
jgi:hypothetical protein